MPQFVVHEGNNKTPRTNEELASALSVIFSRECGFRRLPYMDKEMLRYLNQGFTPDVIVHNIQETARAPRPSFAYFDKIMFNCYCEHAFDIISVLNRKKYTEERKWADLVADPKAEAIADELIKDLGL